MRTKKRILSILLTVCLIVGMLPQTAFATEGATIETSGLCEHHTSHDDSCGFVAGTEKIPCTHEHTADCYKEATSCVHEHDDSCYPADSVSDNDAAPSEAAKPTECVHECSGESGCITEELNCPHTHDSECSYAAEIPETPCGYVCGECTGQNEVCTCETDDPAIHRTDCPVYSAPAEPICTCAERCPEDTPNEWCDICGVQGTAACTGEDSSAEYASNISYIDANGTLQTCISATAVTTGDATWNDGWYYASGNITIGSRVTVNGDVHLTLADDATLIVNGGIEVNEGNSFTIYGQSGQTGSLTAAATAQYNAGIGGGRGSNSGKITINGGIITATGGYNSAGIGGGGNRGSGSDITINGGTITATGGKDGAGIGGAYQGDGSDITISGGTVTAIGGNNSNTSTGSGAGIGGGANGNGSNITIYSGTVTAIGGYNSAGIGGGYGSYGTVTITGGTVEATGGRGAGIGGGGANGNGGFGTVTITGGTVIATSNNSGAGIGGGYGSSTGGYGTVTITGGTVTATGDGGGAGIGGGRGSTGGIGKVTITGGIVTANGGGNIGVDIGGGFSSNSGTVGGSIVLNGTEGTVDGNVALNTDLTIPDGSTLTISSDATLTVDTGVTLTNNGTINNNGSINNNGTIDNNGTINNNGSINNNGTITHNHDWTGAWGSNGTHHWKECANSGCDVTDNSKKGSYGEHTYTSGVCVCGKTAPGTSGGAAAPDTDGGDDEDTPVPPVPPAPTTPTNQPTTTDSSGWTEIKDEIGNTPPGGTVHVDMNGATVVPGEIWNEIAGKDITVEFDMGGGFLWTVNGKDIPTGDTEYITYTVQKGDTLWAISRTYGCPVADIMAANSDLIKAPDLIYPGWQLKIPQAEETGTDTPDAILPDDKKTTVYIVKQGDTLWAISKKYGCTVAEIVALNGKLIDDPNLIFTEWELKIPQE